ncbi:hypothetical protein CDQ83_09815 [Clostridium thermosuccinogenes]|nr:hypothetical protein CDQ83_09815 [Pseudoclostridium thermosuccinogenes]
MKAIYFYTPTCSSCQKLTSFFDDLQDKHKDFIDGEIDSCFFDLDYSAYVIEHFPYMEEEE